MFSILFPKESFQFTFPSTVHMKDGIYHTFVNTGYYPFSVGSGGDVYLVVFFFFLQSEKLIN